MLSSNKDDNFKQISFDNQAINLISFEYVKLKGSEFNLESIISVIPFVFESIKSDNQIQECYGIRTLYQIMKISNYIDKAKEYPSFCEKSYENIAKNEQIKSSLSIKDLEFLLFILHKISSDIIHPYFVKMSLKLLRLLMMNDAEIANLLLQNNFNNILIQLLPNKYSIKCISTLLDVHEGYRMSIIESNFHKTIFRFIFNVRKTFSPFGYLYERYYMEILCKIQPFIQFDNEDYDIFLSYFVGNFFSVVQHNHDAQLPYTNFLISSNDPLLMLKFINHPKNIIYGLIKNFNKPAYSPNRTKILQYFERIIKASDELAQIFANQSVSDCVTKEFFNVDGLLKPVSHFILTIILSSFENAQNFMSKELFDTLVFNYVRSSFDDHTIVFLVLAALMQYPSTSTFFSFFTQSPEFDLKDFLEFSDTILENESDGKFEVITMFDNILNDIIAGGYGNPIWEFTLKHIASEDFISILQKDSKDEIFMQKAKLLSQRIEDFVDTL